MKKLAFMAAAVALASMSAAPALAAADGPAATLSPAVEVLGNDGGSALEGTNPWIALGLLIAVIAGSIALTGDDDADRPVSP